MNHRDLPSPWGGFPEAQLSVLPSFSLQSPAGPFPLKVKDRRIFPLPPALELEPKRACGVHCRVGVHMGLWLGTLLHQFSLLLNIHLLIFYLEYACSGNDIDLTCVSVRRDICPGLVPRLC